MTDLEEEGGRYSSSEIYLFAEETEALERISLLNDISARDGALTRLRQILDKYLECPTLLDQSLEVMVKVLAYDVRSRIESQDCCNDDPSSIRYHLSALYSLSKVRGRKVIQRCLPHGVEDVEPMWNGLLKEISSAKSAGDTGEDSAPQWQSEYMLWSWMQVLSLVPFDCVVLADDQLVPFLLAQAKRRLSESGPIREAAATCLAAWMSRPDLEGTQLPLFVEWSRDVVEQYRISQQPSNLFRILGVLQTLTTILKQSPIDRDLLISQLAPLWDRLLIVSESRCDNLLLRKLLVKWWTRMSCAYLPPRVAPWRYQRGKRSLVENLQKENDNNNTSHLAMPALYQTVHQDYLIELFDVPDQVEDGIGRLIESVGHSSTVVRWSAAKGVGRIAERLPAVCADDILDAILEYFEDFERDNCWHGACLALAELARRGLLLPSRLGDVVPHIVVAVQYDVQRGHKTVGAHVRDAACYTYWAFARAYTPSIMRPYMRELSESIILTSLFDREVNCRRAASAAFQEAVGRQGATNFPHGIKILTAADYFSLGNRNDAYTSIAKAISQFEEYRRVIVRHLLMKKLSHWDVVIRELASKSLSLLTNLDPCFVGGVALPCLLEKSLDPKNLHVRHGAVLGSAEVTLALSEISGLHPFVSSTTMAALVALVPSIEKKRLYRGRGGEIMRSAVCRLVECMALANVPLTTQDQVHLLDSVDASIPHPSEAIQRSACMALEQLMSTYFPVREMGPTPRLQARVVDKFVKQVSTNDNPGATRGYALALGCLPLKLLAPSKSVLGAILDCLGRTARFDSLVGGESDAETRRNALESLRRISETVGIGARRHRTSYPAVGIDIEQVHVLFDIYLLALKDYRSDKRGDVGCWCRMAALDGLVTLVQNLARTPDVNDRVIYPQRLTCIVGAMLKQLSEQLDTVRQKAGESLEKLLSISESALPRPSCYLDVAEALELSPRLDSADQRKWGDPTFTFPKTLRAACVGDDVYFSNVIAGTAISVGGLTKSVAKASGSSLLEWVDVMKGTEYVEKLGFHLLTLLIQNHGYGRISLPVIKTIHFLILHCCLDGLIQSNSSNFAGSCLDAFVQAELGCDDVHRLHALVDATVSLVDSLEASTTKRRALAFLCKMLIHRFPRVRIYTAEHFYVVLLDHADQSAMNVLLETPWSSEEQDLIMPSRLLADGLGITLEFLAFIPKSLCL